MGWRSAAATPDAVNNRQKRVLGRKIKAYFAEQGGVVVANPIPAEAEIPAEEIAPVIEAAVKKAQVQGIMGKETTPFLLAEIAGREVDAQEAWVRLYDHPITEAEYWAMVGRPDPSPTVAVNLSTMKPLF